MSEHSRTGRRRLMLVLSLLGGGACLVAMGLVLVFYGTPYNPIWWWVMGAVLVAASLLSCLLAHPIEWVMRGYRGED